MRRPFFLLPVLPLAAACSSPDPRPIAPPPVLTAPASTADRDDDCVPDGRDRCPDEPEDGDGIADEDGCPELDHDRDRIPDTCDVCPDAPETYQGWGDRDGCPDTSADIHAQRDQPGEHREPGPKDTRCTESWAPPPPLPPRCE
jgi:hypothetical protein